MLSGTDHCLSLVQICRGTDARREFVATAGNHSVEFDMCFFDNDQAESAHTVSKRTTRLASDAKTHPYLV